MRLHGRNVIAGTPSIFRHDKSDFSIVETKTLEEFVRREGSGSQFCDDNAAGVIRDFRRFDWRSTGNHSECEERNRRIASSGDIVNLARTRWRMIMDHFDRRVTQFERDARGFSSMLRAGSFSLNSILAHAVVDIVSHQMWAPSKARWGLFGEPQEQAPKLDSRLLKETKGEVGK